MMGLYRATVSTLRTLHWTMQLTTPDGLFHSIPSGGLFGLALIVAAALLSIFLSEGVRVFTTKIALIIDRSICGAGLVGTATINALVSMSEFPILLFVKLIKRFRHLTDCAASIFEVYRNQYSSDETPLTSFLEAICARGIAAEFCQRFYRLAGTAQFIHATNFTTAITVGGVSSR